jgi:outer membrane protein TolC
VDVEKAWRKLERSQMMLDVAQEALALRRESERIARDQVAAGLVSDAKQADAVAARRAAESDELQAKFACALALVEIDRLTGAGAR